MSWDRPYQGERAQPLPVELEPGVAVRLVGVTLRESGDAGLRDVSLHVRSGEWLAIFGPPAAGKSLLLRVIHRDVRPEVGDVAVAQAFLVPQDLPNPPRTQLKQWLAGRLARYGVPRPRGLGRVAATLEALGIEHLSAASVATLSPTQRLLGELALGLATELPLLLLDEVLARLPEPVAERVRAHLDDRRAADGLTVLEATGVARCAEYASRVAVMRTGRILVCEDTQSLLRRYAPDVVTIEAADPSMVRKTLHGLFDIVMTETPSGLRFETADGVEAAANVFRHPSGGVRVVVVTHGSLWDVLRRLEEGVHESAA